jgi:flagellin
MAQENLECQPIVESRTIQRLTSGFRINFSGDDAAGLAVANQYRADIAELTQGVQNASNGLTQLQIVDGGLNNVSQMLDRMKTLAAESASGTFTGDRSTLDTEYQKLITEITRQASNINLNAGGTFNSNLNVYIGGAAPALWPAPRRSTLI